MPIILLAYLLLRLWEVLCEDTTDWTSLLAFRAMVASLRCLAVACHTGFGQASHTCSLMASKFNRLTIVFKDCQALLVSLLYPVPLFGISIRVNSTQALP